MILVFTSYDATLLLCICNVRVFAMNLAWERKGNKGTPTPLFLALLWWQGVTLASLVYSNVRVENLIEASSTSTVDARCQ